ncbi:MAG: leucyl aminopeptidase [Myxococcota bacterium]|nr:leucyl aminopeptidase [Myxococcota bacterium]
MAAARSRKQSPAPLDVSVSARRAADCPADWLVLPLCELDPARWRLPARAQAVDRALSGRIGEVLSVGDFRGRRGQTLVLYPGEGCKAERILLLGLGEDSELDAEGLREAAGRAIRAAESRGGKSLAILAPSSRRLKTSGVAQALAEGLVLGAYRFDRYQSNGGDDEPRRRVESAQLLFESGDTRAARTAAATGIALSESQNLARDLSNEPPNHLPPVEVAKRATDVAKEVGLKIRIMEPAELKRRKFGAMMAVAQGSANPPRLIVLEHNAPKKGAAGSRGRKTICLVGKGVCFDSGGLSLKPSTSMVKMKHDMSGGATVIGAMRAAALLRVPHHVVGIVGAVENMPSGTAYRPDDVITSACGKTIEVQNTDAEGRLVLADCLHLARTEFDPIATIDLATLTGACGVALGSWSAAVLGNHERLVELLIRSGEKVGERFWQLPLWDVHREHMRSKIADVKQTGGREGGTITAAAFLWHFAGDGPWAHLDIASVADSETGTPLHRGGATGFGVRTLIELLHEIGEAKL